MPSVEEHNLAMLSDSGSKMTTHRTQDPSLRPDLFAGLRLSTAHAHRGLEEELGLLRPPLTKLRFVRVLAKFLGFHREWEHAMDRHERFAGIFAGRTRVGRLESDLAALGMSETQMADIPPCAAAHSLTRTEAAAMGSLYVMEGSTLGGEHISRALARQDWAPAHGLAYFKPYAEQTRERWETLRQWANEGWQESDWPPIERGANDTFDVLQAWFHRD